MNDGIPRFVVVGGLIEIGVCQRQSPHSGLADHWILMDFPLLGSAPKGSDSNVPMPTRAEVASGTPIRSVLIPCSDDLFVPVPGQVKIHVEKLWTLDDFGFAFQELESGLEQSQSYHAATPYRNLQIERFGAGVSKFGQAFEWYSHSALESGPPVRANTYSYHAAASRRFRISDGLDLWSQGRVVFVPPASQSVAPGTPPPPVPRAFPNWRTSFRGTRRGRNRIKRFRAGLRPGQCSHLFWRILAETFTTPRHEWLCLVQGRNQDLRVRLHALPHPG
jgi:hypothetical protein